MFLIIKFGRRKGSETFLDSFCFYIEQVFWKSSFSSMGKHRHGKNFYPQRKRERENIISDMENTTYLQKSNLKTNGGAHSNFLTRNICFVFKSCIPFKWKFKIFETFLESIKKNQITGTKKKIFRDIVLKCKFLYRKKKRKLLFKRKNLGCIWWSQTQGAVEQITSPFFILSCSVNMTLTWYVTSVENLSRQEKKY